MTKTILCVLAFICFTSSTFALNAKVNVINNTQEALIVRISHKSSDRPYQFIESLPANAQKNYRFNVEDYNTFVSITNAAGKKIIIEHESDCIHATYSIVKPFSNYEVSYRCTF